MICYQQLAGRAAAAIHGRFEALFDGPPTPDGGARTAVRDVARRRAVEREGHVDPRPRRRRSTEGLVELDRVARLPDDKVVRELVLVRGIGEWTAHMFLMFQMGRLDVWPVARLRRAQRLRAHVRPDEMPTPKQLARRGRPVHAVPVARRVVVLAARPTPSPPNN